MALLRILALALTAIILVPSAAHLFELPGKIGLGRDAYFTVQAIYAGWSLFGIPIIAAILGNGALAFAERGLDVGAARWALVSSILIAASLVVFFIWIFPANQATSNWTTQIEDWEDLRTQWEYGHATNAVLVFLACLATCMAAVKR